MITFIIASSWADDSDAPYLSSVKAKDIENAITQFFTDRKNCGDERFEDPELLAECLNQVYNDSVEFFVETYNFVIEPLDRILERGL